MLIALFKDQRPARCSIAHLVLGEVCYGDGAIPDNPDLGFPRPQTGFRGPETPLFLQGNTWKMGIFGPKTPFSSLCKVEGKWGFLDPETLFSRKWGFGPCLGSGESQTLTPPSEISKPPVQTRSFVTGALVPLLRCFRAPCVRGKGAATNLSLKTLAKQVVNGSPVATLQFVPALDLKMLLRYVPRPPTRTYVLLTYVLEIPDSKSTGKNFAP